MVTASFQGSATARAHRRAVGACRAEHRSADGSTFIEAKSKKEGALKITSEVEITVYGFAQGAARSAMFRSKRGAR